MLLSTLLLALLPSQEILNASGGELRRTAYPGLEVLEVGPQGLEGGWLRFRDAASGALGVARVDGALRMTERWSTGAGVLAGAERDGPRVWWVDGERGEAWNLEFPGVVRGPFPLGQRDPQARARQDGRGGLVVTTAGALLRLSAHGELRPGSGRMQRRVGRPARLVLERGGQT